MKELTPKKIRLPKSTRGTQVHSSVNDYNRNLEKEEVAKELEESESELLSGPPESLRFW